MRRVLTFRFDYISPYAYLAWTQIHRLAERHDVDVVAVPVLFAGLLNAFGHKGPAEIPPKRIYTFKDCTRRAAALEVPFASPPTHPFKPLLALRVTLAADAPPALVDGLFAATWGGTHPKGVDDPRVVRQIADAAGLDGEALLARAEDDDVKTALRAATDHAIACGVFGVPMMTVDDEPFWGVDSLPFLERFLRGEDAAAAISAGRDVPSSATRRVPSQV